MSSIDKQPTPEFHTSTMWNDSTINICDPYLILDEASGKQVTIFSEHSIVGAGAVRSIEVKAEDVHSAEDSRLVLDFNLKLNQDPEITIDNYRTLFSNFIRGRHLEYLPVEVKPTVFRHAFRAFDKEIGGEHVVQFLELNKEPYLRISNNVAIVDPMLNGVALEVKAPIGLDIRTEDQIISLMRIGIMAVDCMSEFDKEKYLKSGILQASSRRIYNIMPENWQLLQHSSNVSDLSKMAGKTATKGVFESHRPITEDRPEVKLVKYHDVESVAYQPEQRATLSDVGGLFQVKEILRDIAISFLNPDIMKKWGSKRPQGILLHGPPGTGKTMLAEAFANEIGAELWPIQSNDIYDKWLGSSEKNLEQLFNQLREVPRPTILFLDEFESIVAVTSEPTSGADRARNSVAGLIKQELNGIAQSNPNVLIMAATNDIDSIDPSLRRSGRFDYTIYVPLPDHQARQEIFANVMSQTIIQNEDKDFRIFDEDIKLGHLADVTEDFSGADITEIFRRLCFSKAMQEARTKQEQPPITHEEIIQAIRVFKSQN
ncbi:ATP-binding protein [Candidatus Saccharibacteria bacterium]|nr:ATP-binding protein [Candidatus Saccharibacteria bacterium]